MEDKEDKLYCPHCGSSQLVANKKGFGAGKALTGAVLTGGVGLLAGFIGSGKVKVTCLKCGCTWKPGELLTEPYKGQEDTVNAADWSFWSYLGVVAIVLIISFAIYMCS